MPNIPPPFTAPYAPDDADIAARLLPFSPLSPPQEARIDRTATRLIEAIRKRDDRLAGWRTCCGSTRSRPRKGSR